MSKSIIRRAWSCNLCKYKQEGVMSYYKWRKMYTAHYELQQHQDAVAESRKRWGF